MNLNELFEDGLSTGFENDEVVIEEPVELPFDELGIESMYAEYAAVERRMTRFGELFQQTLLSKSISRGVAMEALELYPDFDSGKSPKMYTEHPTQTRYKVAVEEFTKGQMLLGAGLGAILLGIIWRLLKWVFTGENTTPPSNTSAKDITKLVTAEQVPAAEEVKATKEAVETANKVNDAINDDIPAAMKIRGSIKLGHNNVVEIHSMNDLDKLFHRLLEENSIRVDDPQFNGAFVRSLFANSPYVTKCQKALDVIKNTFGEYERAFKGVITDIFTRTQQMSNINRMSKDDDEVTAHGKQISKDHPELANSGLAEKLKFSVRIDGELLVGRDVSRHLKDERAKVPESIPKFDTVQKIFHTYCNGVLAGKNIVVVKELCESVDTLVDRIEKLSREIEQVDDSVSVQTTNGSVYKSEALLTSGTADIFRTILGNLREQVAVIQDLILFVRADLRDYHNAIKHVYRIQQIWIDIRLKAYGEHDEEKFVSDEAYRKFLYALDATLADEAELKKDKIAIGKVRTYVYSSGIKHVEQKMRSSIKHYKNRLKK